MCPDSILPNWGFFLQKILKGLELSSFFSNFVLRKEEKRLERVSY